MTDYIELQVTDDGVIETEVSEQIVIGGAASLQTKSVSYTPTESAQSAQVTPDVGYDGMSRVNVSVGAISSSYVGSGVTRRTSSDLTKNGATITAPAGYYESSASKSVTSGTAGTPTASKGAVSNHAISVTPSVTNQSGYISGSTITGTAVSVSASELVSGTKSITENGTGIDVTEYAAVDVNVSGGGGPLYPLTFPREETNLGDNRSIGYSDGRVTLKNQGTLWSGNTLLNLTDRNTSPNYHPTWFTIPTGTAVLNFSNVSNPSNATWNMNFRLANTQTSSVFGIGDGTHLSGETVTVNVTSAINVGCIFLYTANFPANATLSFDISFTVNGERYI